MKKDAPKKGEDKASHQKAARGTTPGAQAKVGAHSVNVPVARLGESKAKRAASTVTNEQQSAASRDSNAVAASASALEATPSQVGAHPVVGSRLGESKTKRDSAARTRNSQANINTTTMDPPSSTLELASVTESVGAHSVLGSRLGESKTKRDATSGNFQANNISGTGKFTGGFSLLCLCF